MKNLKKNLISLYRRHWPIIFALFLILIFFWKFFILGKIPIPADLVVGAYYPWLDYKWGYEVGVPVKNPITSDVVSQIYPLKSYLVDMLLNCKSILWNPTMFGGYPLLANPILATFSPTFLLYFILPKVYAWSFQIILQPILGTFFTYLLLRHFKLSKISSLFGGLFFAFSGFNLIWLEWNIHSLTSSWIPLLFLVVDKYLLEQKTKYLIYLSFLLSFQIFSGYPQIVIYTLIALGIFVFVRRKILVDKINLMLLLFIIIGFLLSAIQIIPITELYLKSQRITEIISKDIMFLPFKNLISLFAPDYFGNHATYNFWGEGNYTNNVVYSGIVVFVLASIGVANYKKKIEIKYFLVVLIISLLIALPFGISKALFNLGLHGSKAASATRILVFTNFAMAVLSAYGVEAFFLNQKKWIFKSLLIPAISLMLVFIYSLNKFFVNINELIVKNMIVGVRNLIFPFAILILLSILFYIYKIVNKFKIKLIVLFMICILGVFELFRFGWKYTPFSNKEMIFPDTPIINFLKNQQKPFRIINGDVIPKNMWVPYGLESIEGYDPVYPTSIAKLLGVLDKGVSNANKLDRYGFVSNFDSQLINLVNTKYILVKNTDTQNISKLKNKGYKEVFVDKTVLVFENNNFIPRTFMVFDWEISSDESYILNKLIDPTFVLNRKVILEKDPSILKSSDNKYIINFEKYEPGRLILNLNSNKDGVLFLSSIYYPGWEAYIDDKKTEIIKADFTFQSIVVPKGEHKIEFIYNPKSFRIGKLITIVTFISLITLYLYERRKKQSS